MEGTMIQAPKHRQNARHVQPNHVRLYTVSYVAHCKWIQKTVVDTCLHSQMIFHDVRLRLISSNPRVKYFQNHGICQFCWETYWLAYQYKTEHSVEVEYTFKSFAKFSVPSQPKARNSTWRIKPHCLVEDQTFLSLKSLDVWVIYMVLITTAEN